jgi:hypothetical protein
MDPKGPSKPGEIRVLNGRDWGLDCDEVAGQVFGWFSNRTDLFFLFEPWSLAGYPKLFLTLSIMNLTKGDFVYEGSSNLDFHILT